MNNFTKRHGSLWAPLLRNSVSDLLSAVLVALSEAVSCEHYLSDRGGGGGLMDISGSLEVHPVKTTYTIFFVTSGLTPEVGKLAPIYYGVVMVG